MPTHGYLLLHDSQSIVPTIIRSDDNGTALHLLLCLGNIICQPLVITAAIPPSEARDEVSQSYWWTLRIRFEAKQEMGDVASEHEYKTWIRKYYIGMKKRQDSEILVKSQNFKEEKVKFRMNLRVNLGTTQYQEVFEQAKALGLNPTATCLVISYDLDTEEAAKEAVAQYHKQGLQSMPKGIIESIQAMGKKVIIHMASEASMGPIASQLTSFAPYLQDLAIENQFFELNIETDQDPQSLLGNVSPSLLRSILDCLRLNVILSTNKDLPIKAAEFMKTLLPASEHQRAKLMGKCLAAFSHLNLTIALNPPSEDMQEAQMQFLMPMCLFLAQFVCSMMMPLSILKPAKSSSVIMTIRGCVSPMLSITSTMQIPEVLDIEQATHTFVHAQPTSQDELL